jgi:hypothetical protein
MQKTIVVAVAVFLTATGMCLAQPPGITQERKRTSGLGVERQDCRRRSCGHGHVVNLLRRVSPSPHFTPRRSAAFTPARVRSEMRDFRVQLECRAVMTVCSGTARMRPRGVP